ncbi:MAG: uL13 family ribosomal protein, partial [Planctomycetes bacterium]|nr:uL13 family ribosomal protein [Planctomycetota bacterium]
TRVYTRWTGHIGGQREETLGQLLEHDPEKLIKTTVRRMLPKNRIARDMLRLLKVYRDANHPHGAQQPKELVIER